MAYSHVDPASSATQYLSPQAPVRSSSRWLAPLGAGLGLLAVGAGVVGCSRPAAPSEAARQAYSDQQVGDAKRALCDAYAKGMRSIRTVAKRQPDSDADRLGVAVNSRVGEVAVSTYFLTAIGSNPAAPDDLKNHLGDLAHQYQELVLIQLSDGGPSDWKGTVEKIDELVSKTDQLCQ